MSNVSVIQKINSSRARSLERALSFGKITDHVLGSTYTLSVVFTDDKHAKTLNKEYRRKNEPTNVLSFSLSPTEGELFINIEQAIREYADFGTTLEMHVLYLFIHALLHLKGLEHGSTMEKEEQRILEIFRS